MKLFFVFLFFSVSKTILCQELKSPKMLIETSFGSNNETKMMERWLAKNNDTAFFITSSGVTPIGVKLDLINRPRFQWGIEFMYNRVTLYYFENSYLDIINEVKTPTIMEDFNKYKILLRSSYLFPSSTNKIQFYSSLSLGINIVKNFNIIYDSQSEISDTKIINKGPLLFSAPISIRAYIGTRYYFTKNIGFHLEAGFGGSIMNGGLTFRILNRNTEN